MTFHLPRALQARLATWSRLGLPRESCGLLIGREREGCTEVERVTWARNLEAARDRFEVDPGDLVAAQRTARGAGLDVVGVWHSHPRGGPQPSRSDREGAHAGWSHAVLDLGGSEPELRAFRLRGDRFVEQIRRSGQPS